MSTPKPADKAQISATVPTSVKTALAQRGVDEDREPGRVIARAVEVYLSLSLDDAEAAVRKARNGTKVEP